MFEAAVKMDPGSGAGMTNSEAGMTNSEAGMTKRRARLGFTQIYTTDTSSACKKAMIQRCNNS
jgi:hypothetical protein